ncbi:hypothetical protein CQA57_02700 [Helicobacter anseris]|uniref:50S ribosomal protein L22 n=1 Tax=Helicobacter anseris TaxID=375926 RepID=A0A3D8JAJ5_9HELI|nr:hypothetical protein [Helicobacter anseris]RDU74195.1 hypothetical protein CQA57_02700 [Helicobacter anseris]
MNLKQNLDVVKNEFKSDEKIFESAFRIERFIKKYKYLLLGVLLVCIGIFIFFQIDSKIQENRALRATEVFDKLLIEPNNQALIDVLKQESPQLYEMFSLSQAMKTSDEKSLKDLSKSKNDLVKNFASYQLASLQKDEDALGRINTDGFGDLAKMQQAFLKLQTNDYKEAAEILQSIGQDSVLKEMVKLLLHYQYGAK